MQNLHTLLFQLPWLFNNKLFVKKQKKEQVNKTQSNKNTESKTVHPPSKQKR